MRKERTEIVVPKDWRKKIRVRGETRKLIKRGEIVKKPCQLCFAKDSRIAHVDYESPHNVTWLCNPHYLLFQRDRHNRQNVSQNCSTE